MTVPVIHMSFEDARKWYDGYDFPEVDTESFENDFETFKSRDDVLTLLIHLGYLAWHEEEGTAYIPNEEVRTEFRKILKEGM